MKRENEWSGTPCPDDPDNCWIDDETGEHVNAIDGTRSTTHPAIPRAGD
jgi:hypothetical protein